MNSLLRSPLLRRSAFVGANLAVCATAVIFVVLPAYDLFAERDARIAAQRPLLVRMMSIAKQEESIQSLARRAGTNRDDFLVGPNDGVINADLQTRLKGMAEGAGARMRSLQTLSTITSDKTRYNGTRMDILGSIQSVHRAIHEIENAKPHFFITAAVIKSSPATVGARPGSAEQPLIQAQLDVFGAVQIEGRDR